MDEQRFDAVLRMLGAAAGRRQAVACVLAAVLGGGASGALATGRPRRKSRRTPEIEGPCGDGSRKHNTCMTHGECCTGVCNLKTAKRNKSGTGRCRCVKRGKACTASRNCCRNMTCVKGVCAIGGGSGCTSNRECPSSAPVCSGGVCVECAANSDCPAAAPVCVGNACLECSANGDCPAGKPICDGNVCVECVADGDCPGASPFCSGAVCVECLANGDCGGTSDTCADGVCACGSSPACGGATPICCNSGCAAGTWGNQTRFGSVGAQVSNLNTPRSVVLSVDGLTAMIADQANNRVSVWTRPGTTGSDATNWSNQATFGSGPGAGDAEFNQIWTAVLSVDGLTAVVMDGGNNRVSVWTRPNLDAGVANWGHQANFGSAGSDADQFSGPGGAALSTDGLTVAVADTGHKRVSVWTRTTPTGTDWSHQVNFGSGPGTGPGDFKNPYRISLSVDGRTAAISDTTNYRVSMWIRSSATATDWQPQVPFGSGPGSNADQFNGVTSVQLATDGLSAAMSEVGNDRVSVWTRTTPDGTDWAPHTIFGSGPGASTSQFSNPYMASYSANGLTALVADTDNNRISVWTLVCPP